MNGRRGITAIVKQSSTIVERAGKGGLETVALCLRCLREEFLASETGTVLLLMVGLCRRRHDELDRRSKLRGSQ